MTTIDIPATPAASTAMFIGQATAVEQARAVAEVQAAIVVAQQCPRNMARAIEQMRQSCRQKGLAERAFFRYSRGEGQITGPSVHLAREVARCFGNVQYGISELRRDDDAGLSEMQAWAWDVETNTRAATTFVVPHKRDTKKGVKALVDMRDIYENNANNGARRLREQIFAILPTWFVEEAKDICAATIRDGGGKPLPQRIADAVKAFEGRGITVEQLEKKLGRKVAAWTEYDVAQLLVVFTSLQRGETTNDDEFTEQRAPEQRVTAAEITGGNQPREADEPDPTPPPADGPAALEPEQAILPTSEPTGPAATRQQLTKLHAVFGQLDVTDRAYRLRAVGAVIGRPVDSTNDLTKDEAKVAIDTLESVATSADPLGRLAVIVDPDLAEDGDDQ